MPAAPASPPSESGAAFAGNKDEPRGYFLALSHVSEVQRFQQYRSVVAKLRQIYAGRELVRTQPVVTATGPPTDGVLTIVEHATLSKLRMLLAAPEYVALMDEMGRLAPGPTWAVPGVWPPPAPLPKGVPPRAYAVAQYRINDSPRLNRLRDLLARIAAAQGARILVRLEPFDPGGITPADRFLALVEFPSPAALRAAQNSADFRDLLTFGLEDGDLQVWLVEGVVE